MNAPIPAIDFDQYDPAAAPNYGMTVDADMNIGEEAVGTSVPTQQTPPPAPEADATE